MKFYAVSTLSNHTQCFELNISILSLEILAWQNQTRELKEILIFCHIFNYIRTKSTLLYEAMKSYLLPSFKVTLTRNTHLPNWNLQS